MEPLIIRILVLLLPLLFLYLHSGECLAQKIKVVTEELPPYQEYNADGILEGFSTKIIQELFKITGDEADIEVLPWARAYKIAENTANVMIFSLSKTELRQPKFHWLGKLTRENLFLWGLKAKFNRPLPSIDDVKRFTIATTQSSNPEQYFTQHGFPNLYRVTNADQSMSMLFAERVDLMLGAEAILKRRAKELNVDFSLMTKVHQIDALNHDLYVAFNIASEPALISRFQEAYKTLEQNGFIDSQQYLLQAGQH